MQLNFQDYGKLRGNEAILDTEDFQNAIKTREGSSLLRK